MALLEIAQYPEKCLREKAARVETFDEELKKLANDMAETMYHAPGVGLAAPQIRVLKQMFVLDTSENKNALQVFINPEIIESSGSQVYEEGCLSIPGAYEKVTRPEFITVKAQDLDGKAFEIEADGLLSVCIQHELDHLHGILFLDHLSRLKRTRLISKLEKKHLESKQSNQA